MSAAERLHQLCALASRFAGVSGTKGSMVAFLRDDIVSLANEIADTHADVGVRALARDLALEAGRL